MPPAAMTTEHGAEAIPNNVKPTAVAVPRAGGQRVSGCWIRSKRAARRAALSLKSSARLPVSLFIGVHLRPVEIYFERYIKISMFRKRDRGSHLRLPEFFAFADAVREVMGEIT